MQSPRPRRPTRPTKRDRLAELTSPPSLRGVIFSPSIERLGAQVAAATAVLAALVVVAWIVYRTGGTQYAYPYLILLPVIFAAAVFKVPGGLLAALLAALLLGPYMPLNTETGVMQTTHNWLVRLVLYLTIGGFAGGLATALDAARRRALFEARTDTGSGLVSPTVARQLVSAKRELGFKPTFAVAVGFDGYEAATLAMGFDATNQIVGRLGRHLGTLCASDALATRIHGATFCILVSGDEQAVDGFIDRCNAELPRTLEIDGVPIPVLLRFGVANLSDSDRLGAAPFRKAMVALRAALDNGQRVSRHDGTPDAEGHDNLRLLSEFRDDIEEGRCELHFQPKLDLASDRIYGVEALIRWTSATRGAVPPGRFLPLVENTMLIDTLSRFVVDQAGNALAAWRSQGIDLHVAINISMHNLEDEAFIEHLINAPKQHGVSPEHIELELTETALMRRIAVAKDALQRLRDAGFSISVDDFGTGHSSLRYLKDLPIDWVKLDQSFVRDLPDNAASREISAATSVMCKRLGLKTVAEGVETPQALDYLRGQGYDAVQGYHIGAPMPAEVLQAWLNGSSGGPSTPS